MHWCGCHIIAQNCVSALIEWSLSRLSLFFVGQSVNCSFFVCFVFGIMTKTIWLWRSESSVNLPRLTCSQSSVNQARWWSPGRTETLACSEVRASLNSSLLVLCLGCSGIADSHFPDPSPSAFPVASLCSGRCSVCASLWSLKLRLYFSKLYLRSQDESANVTSFCAVSLRAFSQGYWF